MNTVEFINRIGAWYVDCGLVMLLQSSILIILLLIADRVMKQRVRAVVRYALWLLVLVKLVLPVGVAVPWSPFYWLQLPEQTVVAPIASDMPGNNILSGPAITQDNPPAKLSIEPAVIEPSPEPVVTSQATPEITPSPAIVDQPGIPAHAGPELCWQAMVFLVWSIVVLILFALLLQRYWFVRSLIAQAAPSDDHCYEILLRAKARLNISRSVRLGMSANSLSPSVCGLTSPVILIPADMTSKLSDSQLEAVLLHELVHIRRADLWLNLCQTILQILYFWHPLLWLANDRIRTIREQAVDEAVLVSMQDRADDYSETLIHVSKLAWSRPMLSLRLIGVVESKSALTARIRHILSRPIPGTAKVGRKGILAIILAAAIILPMAKGATGNPEFTIKGKVVDSVTGAPIANARVGDIENYNKGIFSALTDEKGEYSYKTWYEEHFIQAKATSYKTAENILLTKVLGGETEKVIDFELEKEATDESGLQGKLKGFVEDFFKQNFRDITARKDIQWGQPVVGDDGNITIRYKYEATIWDKDKIINNQEFTFTAEGEFVKFKNIIDARDADSVKQLVKKFFNENFRDITARKDIEWSQPVVGDDGNITIRYKYEATIWDKDKVIKNQEFTFTAEGEYVKFKDVAAEDSATAINGNEPFIADLGDGVTVELLGVCENPSVGKKWWKPDGSESDIVNDKVFGKGIGSQGVPYEFMYRVDGFGNDIDVNYKVSSIMGGYDNESCMLKDIEQNVITAYLKEDVEKVTVSIGIASGPWNTVTNYSANNGRGALGVAGNSFMFSEKYIKDGKLCINVTDSMIEFPRRLTAVGKDGKVYYCGQTGSTTMNGVRMSEYRYEGITEDDVKEFQFQVREYKWVDFENVSLRPDVKTAVKAVIRELGLKVYSSYDEIVGKDDFTVADLLGMWEMIEDDGVLGGNVKWCNLEIMPNGESQMEAMGDELHTYNVKYKVQGKRILISNTNENDMIGYLDNGMLIVVVPDNGVVIKFKRKVDDSAVDFNSLDFWQKQIAEYMEAVQTVDGEFVTDREIFVKGSDQSEHHRYNIKFKWDRATGWRDYTTVRIDDRLDPERIIVNDKISWHIQGRYATKSKAEDVFEVQYQHGVMTQQNQWWPGDMMFISPIAELVAADYMRVLVEQMKWDLKPVAHKVNAEGLHEIDLYAAEVEGKKERMSITVQWDDGFKLLNLFMQVKDEKPIMSNEWSDYIKVDGKWFARQAKSYQRSGETMQMLDEIETVVAKSVIYNRSMAVEEFDYIPKVGITVSDQIEGKSYLAWPDLEKIKASGGKEQISVSGTVYLDGKPVESVNIETMTLYEQGTDIHRTVSAKSDKDGKYSLVGLVPGMEYTLTATSKSGIKVSNDVQTSSDGIDVKGIDINLSSGESQKGRVFDWQGKPVAGAVVLFSGMNQVTTDADGVYEVRGLLSDKVYKIEASAIDSSQFTLNEYKLVPDGKGGITDFDISLEKEHVLTGYVVDENGKGIANSRIIGFFNGFIGDWQWSNVYTDENGYFELGNLDSGLQQVSTIAGNRYYDTANGPVTIRVVAGKYGLDDKPGRKYVPSDVLAKVSSWEAGYISWLQREISCYYNSVAINEKITVLTEQVKSVDDKVRREALVRLGNIEAIKAVDLLLDIVKAGKDNEDVRLAMRALGRIGDVRAAETIWGKLGDSDDLTAAVARVALIEMFGKDYGSSADSWNKALADYKTARKGMASFNGPDMLMISILEAIATGKHDVALAGCLPGSAGAERLRSWLSDPKKVERLKQLYEQVERPEDAGGDVFMSDDMQLQRIFWKVKSDCTIDGFGQLKAGKTNRLFRLMVREIDSDFVITDIMFESDVPYDCVGMPI